MEKEEQHMQYWKEAASDYSSNTPPVRIFYEPVVLELLGNVFGKRILDAGYGDGRYSRKLNSRLPAPETRLSSTAGLSTSKDNPIRSTNQ